MELSWIRRSVSYVLSKYFGFCFKVSQEMGLCLSWLSGPVRFDDVEKSFDLPDGAGETCYLQHAGYTLRQVFSKIHPCLSTMPPVLVPASKARFRHPPLTTRARALYTRRRVAGAGSPRLTSLAPSSSSLASENAISHGCSWMLCGVDFAVALISFLGRDQKCQ